MGMLAERVGYVIGVDTHRDSHSAAVCRPNGAVSAEATVAADALGYKRLLRFAREQAPGRRVFAIESTGSYGAGLTSFLLERNEWVVEVDRPGRPARRNGAKSDELDAVKGANIRVAAPLGEGWEDQRHDLLSAPSGNGHVVGTVNLSVFRRHPCGASALGCARKAG